MTIDIDAIRHRQAKLESLADQGATGLKSEAYVMAVALAANLSAADVPDLLAELDKVRAQLADTQKRAHTDATNLQQILRDKTALANERDAMREVVEAAKVWREWYGNTNPSYASACNDLAAAVNALTEAEVAR